MKATIIRIGNSKGIRIPKTVLEQCGIGKDVNMEVKGNNLIIKPAREKPRKGWEKAFKGMSESGDDRLLIDDKIDLDMDDWEW